MARFRTACRVPGTPEKTFEYLSDFQTVAEWDPGVAGAEKLTPGPVGRGTRYRVRIPVLGRESALDYEITRFERPGRVVLEASNLLLTSRDEIRVEPDGMGARVLYDAELRLRGPLAVGEPLLELAFATIGERAAQGLREALGGVAIED